MVRYGISETSKQPTAAHKSDKPESLDTLIPRGIFVVFRISTFTDSELLMADVQMEAAVKINTVATIARHADVRKASVCLTTPLRSPTVSSRADRDEQVSAHHQCKECANGSNEDKIVGRMGMACHRFAFERGSPVNDKNR